MRKLYDITSDFFCSACPKFDTCREKSRILERRDDRMRKHNFQKFFGALNKRAESGIIILPTFSDKTFGGAYVHSGNF